MNKKNPYILSIITSIPFILWAILQILPTFDDWTTLSMPNYDPNYLTYILPFGVTWRSRNVWTKNLFNQEINIFNKPQSEKSFLY